MANNPSAIKRIRQTAKKTEHNRKHVASMRTAIKNYRSAVENNESEAPALLQKAFKEIDSVATKGLIHKNKANRDKSRLSSLLKASKA